MWYIPNNVEQAFQSNLRDWCASNDKSIDQHWCLTRYCKTEIPVDAALAKNAAQTKRWHISFLNDHKIYEETEYWKEYLLPNYFDPKQRADSFLELFYSIKSEGIKRLIWVADVTHLDLGFKYFRFDGCHRLCAAKVLGMQMIGAMTFTINRL